MTQPLEDLARRFTENGFPSFGKDLDVLVARAKAAGVPRNFTEDAAKPDPRLRIPFEIEIPTVSEKVYAETRRAVETAIPGVFIASIRPATMEDLVLEDRQREQRGYPRRLGFVNESKIMRATLPPAMEVFIDLSNFKIDGSNSLSTDAQKAKIAEEAAKIRERLPENVRRFVVWSMMDPSTVSQAEDQYMDTHNGELLMPDFFIRTDVQTVGGGVAVVGRVDPLRQRGVRGWPRGIGLDGVFGALVGVLPRKLAA